ncbi:MAG: terminase large subunit domain-containing protein, partial [Methermicoccaceae archaeon]
MAKSELKTEAHEVLKLLSPSHFWRAIEKPPYPYQHAFLEDTSQHIIIKAGRQTGKSTAAAIKALHTALLPDRSVLIVSPSLRQSTEIFRKVQGYATKAKLAPRRATQTE